MDAKVEIRQPSIVTFHKPCAFNPAGANKAACQSISEIRIRNHGGCTASKCESPWRLCAACVSQSGKPDIVEILGERLCAFHEENGEQALRPQRKNEYDVSLPRRNPYDKTSAASSRKALPSSLSASVSERRPVPTEAKVLPAALRASAPIVKAAPRDASPPSTLASVESAEEGRLILERVRIAISNATYEVVEVARIRAMPNQPRKFFNPEKISRMADSIRSVGQITPGYLRKVEPDQEGHDRELVDGERRWRSIIMAGVKTFRAM
jgi:hypothetical protein